jgi:hypothetical protein
MYLDTQILLELGPVLVACQLGSWCGNKQTYVVTLLDLFCFEMVHAFNCGSDAIMTLSDATKNYYSQFKSLRIQLVCCHSYRLPMKIILSLCLLVHI